MDHHAGARSYRTCRLHRPANRLQPRIAVMSIGLQHGAFGPFVPCVDENQGSRRITTSRRGDSVSDPTLECPRRGTNKGPPPAAATGFVIPAWVYAGVKSVRRIFCRHRLPCQLPPVVYLTGKVRIDEP